MSTLYLPLDAPTQVHDTWSAVAQRIGVGVRRVPGGADFTVPWNGVSARAQAGSLAGRWVPLQAIEVISDRVLLGQHVPTLPAVAAESRQELVDALGEGPVYLKPRINDYKSGIVPTLEHTRWGSAAEVPEPALAAMAQGQLVACPALGNPLHHLEVDFSVGPAGDVRVSHCFRHGFDGGTQPLRMTLDAQAPTTLMAAVQAFCTSHGVVSGLFNIQAVEYGGQWVVMDWNPRPSGMYPGFAHLHPGIADAALAHAAGLSVPQVPVYIELRPYWHTTIPNSAAATVRSFGLHPRWVYDRSRIARIAGVADTREEVEAMFTAFEETL